MKILRSNNNQRVSINYEQDFKTDLGWQENLEQLEDETLKQIINPVENYETVRYIHKSYEINNLSGTSQTDIWYSFYFLSGSTYMPDYEASGLTSRENARMLKQSTESFFRLEFFKTPNNEAPDRSNRKLVFSKNLSLTSGEKYFYTTLTDYIFKPFFIGSNYRNTENMYLFWFQDESAFNETLITGNTFWFTAKYYNAIDGNIIDFTNRQMTIGEEINETEDMYYQMIIDKSDYSYQMFTYTGTTGNRIGISGNPIIFYEKR